MWRLKVHERLKTALWKLLWDVIPTKCSVAAGIGVRAEDRGGCVICGVAEESTKHLLFECLVSRIVWSTSPWSLDIRQFAGNPISEWLKILIDPSLLPTLPREDHHFFPDFCVERLGLHLVDTEPNCAPACNLGFIETAGSHPEK